MKAPLRILPPAAVILGLIALAGCGSSSDSGSTQSAAATSGSGAVVSSADNSSIGQTILVDSNGMTLYLFEKDESDESYCNGGCAKVWPPYTTKGAAQASGDVDASKLGTVKRDDGTTQVTYADHPLYHYADDQKPGDANGNGLDQFGAEWYALQPSGENAEGGDEAGGKDKSDNSGSGYSY